MSLVNLTLVVQAVNFFVAYLILKYLLLKPALQAIAAEDAHQQQLVSQVQENHVRIQEKKQEIQQRWRDCQEEFVQNAPAIAHDELVIRLPVRVLTLEPIHEEKVELRSGELQNELIKKVGHVRH